MGLLGKGALIFWHDIRPGEGANYKDWHSHEHLIERLRVPGFLRGRRGIAATDHPRYLILYEVEGPEVLTSAPYLARLNDPTPWTRQVVANFVDTNRTICTAVASYGYGVGATLLTVRLGPRPGAADSLRVWLAGEVLPELIGRPGITGAHLLIADVEASHTETAEKRLREVPDEIADWTLIVEGYEDALDGVEGAKLAPERLAEHGSIAAPRFNRFRLEHCLSAEDAAS